MMILNNLRLGDTLGDITSSIAANIWGAPDGVRGHLGSDERMTEFEGQWKGVKELSAAIHELKDHPEAIILIAQANTKEERMNRLMDNINALFQWDCSWDAFLVPPRIPYPSILTSDFTRNCAPLQVGRSSNRENAMKGQITLLEKEVAQYLSDLKPEYDRVKSRISDRQLKETLKAQEEKLKAQAQVSMAKAEAKAAAKAAAPKIFGMSISTAAAIGVGLIALMFGRRVIQ